jgi:N-acetyl-anhydromuramyl-L-alanine amidase AmpD
MSFKIQWQESPNYRSGRSGNSIIGICSHQTAGQFPGCLNWLCNSQVQASAHYVISRDGQIFQTVKDEDTAWHAGAVNNPNWSLYDGTNPNKVLIGIEHECYPSVGGDGNLTDIQYEATLWLHKQLIKKWNIPVDRDHLIGHYQIDSVNRINCPGSAFPWDKLISDLTQPTYTPINIQVNGQIFQGVANSGISYAPVRAIAESLNQTVTWDQAGNTVYVGFVPKYYQHTNNIKIAIKNIIIDAIAIDGSTFSPVRKFAEALGKTVCWDQNSNSVIIK